MERSVTRLFTGLALSPAFFLGGMLVAARITRGSTGTDSGIAAGYLGLLLGIGFAALGFALVWVLARKLLTPALMRPVQIADAVLIIGWFAAWHRFMAPVPAFEYSGQRPVLEVEARLTDSLLGDASTSGVAIEFVGGQDLSLPHPEAVRYESGFTVLPWETTPITVREWEVRVFVRGAPSLFRLDLPRRPATSTGWSDWIPPTDSEDYAAPAGLSLRYRFRLIPHGSN